MEKMRLPSQIHLKRSFALLLVGILMMSCSLPFLTGPASAPPVQQNQPTLLAKTLSTTAPAAPLQSTSAAAPAPGQPTPAETDPLDRLLAMRSIKFNLTALSRDGASRSLDVEIDSAGGMHVKSSLPAINPKLLPKGFDPNTLPTTNELYVLDGKAYQPSDQNPAWMTAPLDPNYIQTLSRQMHGQDGPAFWLNLLPEGSIRPGGKDTAGGFAADKYLVNGQVDGQSITGTIWFEPQADALVQAELHVPAALLSAPDKPQKGEVKITLNTQKADVPLVSLPAAPSSQAAATAVPTAAAAAGSPTGSGALAVADIYPLMPKVKIGSSLAAGPGKVWIGDLAGSVAEMDPQDGSILQSVSLVQDTAGATPKLNPIIKMGFDGQNVWALRGFGEKGADHLFAIDPGSMAITHQWDLTQWNLQRDEDHRGTALDFGFSPGKIWLKDQIIDTKTFETKYVGFIGEPHYAFDGQAWMWMTGIGGEDCDGFDLINTDDPSQTRSQCRYPFLNHANEGYSNVGDSSPLVLAGDRIWITGAWPGSKPTYTLEAFSADPDQLKQETKPLVSVPLIDDPQKVKLLYAGNSLWLLWTSGDKKGYLYQLDPHTGATINMLDLIGDQGRAKGNSPMDFATEGHNLWVVTTFQLLRVNLP
jgi:hypothetical protein